MTRPLRIVEAAVSLAVLALWAYVQLVLLRDQIPEMNRDLVLRMLGVLDAAVLTVLTVVVLRRLARSHEVAAPQELEPVP